MIDWALSTTTPDSVHNKDKIIVVCELCKQPRPQLYAVAKRKTTHHCMSCVKTKSRHKTGQMVEYKCIDCPVTKTQQYRPDRFANWRCHHCAMVQGHKDGKFTITSNKPSAAGRQKLAESARARWADPEYRQKWAETRASTKEKRSEFSRSLWADESRLQKLSESLRSIWMTEEYRRKQRAGYTDPVKQLMAQRRAAQAGQPSSIQLQLYKYLDDLGITYLKEGPGTTVGYYVFDCLVQRSDGKKLLIECQGDYWHSLANTQKNDRSKFTYIDRYFPDHEIMYVWEHEFYAKDRVLDRLKLKFGLGIPSVGFDFSDIELGDVPTKDLRSFLDAYHYIGKGRGGKVVGAYHGAELVGCVVFSPPVRQNLGDVTELSRFCLHPSYHKKNFASWLISKAIRGVAGVVVAYADRTVGHTGTIYKACGFKLDHTVPADYWYVDSDGYVMHKKSLYNRAVKNGLAEAEFAARYGYSKHYGGEKLCFIRTCRG